MGGVDCFDLHREKVDARSGGPKPPGRANGLLPRGTAVENGPTVFGGTGLPTVGSFSRPVVSAVRELAALLSPVTGASVRLVATLGFVSPAIAVRGDAATGSYWRRVTGPGVSWFPPSATCGGVGPLS